MTLSAVVEHFPYIGIFLLLIFGGIGFPFPEDTTLILCGFLISNEVVKPIPTFIVAYSGLLMTDFFLYSIGKKYGRAIVTHKRFHKILPPDRFSKLETKFNKMGVLFMLIGRHLVGLRAQIFLVAGVVRMYPLKFLIADALSSILTIALWGGIGFIGGNSLQIIKKDITRIEHIGILFVIILLSIYLLYRYFKSGRDKTLL